MKKVFIGLLMVLSTMSQAAKADKSHYVEQTVDKKYYTEQNYYQVPVGVLHVQAFAALYNASVTRTPVTSVEAAMLYATYCARNNHNDCDYVQGVPMKIDFANRRFLRDKILFLGHYNRHRHSPVAGQELIEAQLDKQSVTKSSIERQSDKSSVGTTVFTQLLKSGIEAREKATSAAYEKHDAFVDDAECALLRTGESFANIDANRMNQIKTRCNSWSHALKRLKHRFFGEPHAIDSL